MFLFQFSRPFWRNPPGSAFTNRPCKAVLYRKRTQPPASQDCYPPLLFCSFPAPVVFFFLPRVCFFCWLFSRNLTEQKIRDFFSKNMGCFLPPPQFSTKNRVNFRVFKLLVSKKTDDWLVVSQIFLEFSSRSLGKIFTHFDDIIFFNWVGSTTN